MGLAIALADHGVQPWAVAVLVLALVAARYWSITG
jgi:hypothetical protein